MTVSQQREAAKQNIFDYLQLWFSWFEFLFKAYCGLLADSELTNDLQLCLHREPIGSACLGDSTGHDIGLG